MHWQIICLKVKKSAYFYCILPHLWYNIRHACYAAKRRKEKFLCRRARKPTIQRAKSRCRDGDHPCSHQDRQGHGVYLLGSPVHRRLSSRNRETDSAEYHRQDPKGSSTEAEKSPCRSGCRNLHSPLPHDPRRMAGHLGSGILELR